MKKKFKKLSLSTETLKNLSETDLDKAAGGVTDVTVRCSVCTHGCSGCAPCA